MVPADQFNYVVAPVVSSLSPLGGPLAGGTAVTITGTGFTGATAVHFGVNLATNLVVVNDTTITVVSPAGTNAVDVLVTTPGGTSASSPSDVFTYGPTVTGLTPAAGPVEAARWSRSPAPGFTGATAVNFGPSGRHDPQCERDDDHGLQPRGHRCRDVTVTVPTGISATRPRTSLRTWRRPPHGYQPHRRPDDRWHAGDDHRYRPLLATLVDFGATPGTHLTVVSPLR